MIYYYPNTSELITTDHTFDPCLPVPHDEVGDAGRLIDERQNRDCESGMGQLELYDVSHPIPIITPIEYRGRCTRVRLPIRHPEEFYRE